MKKSVMFLLMMWTAVTVYSQDVGSMVELKENAPIYKSASTAGGNLATSKNYQQLFKNAYSKGEYLYPFVQKVEKKQQGWIKIAPGWVRESDVEPLTISPIPDETLKSQYLGMLFKDDSNSGLATEFELQFSSYCDNGDLLIFINNGDMGMIFKANLSDDLITCTKFLLVKNIEMGEKNDFSVNVYAKRQDMTVYELIYPQRLNTKIEEVFLDETMEIDTFDPKKMTDSDVKSLSALVEQNGRPTSLCLSGNTLSRMQLNDD